MSLWNSIRSNASVGLNPIIQRAPIPGVALARPSAARPAAKPAPPPPPPPAPAPALPAAVLPPPLPPVRELLPLPPEPGPVHASEIVRRGIEHQRRGDPVAALKDFTRAIEIDPLYVEAYARRGIAREQLGDLDGARRDYSKSIEIEIRAEIDRQSREGPSLVA